MTTDSDELLTKEQVIERLGLSMWQAVNDRLLECARVLGGPDHRNRYPMPPLHPDDRWLSHEIEELRTSALTSGRLVMRDDELVYLKPSRREMGKGRRAHTAESRHKKE